MRPEDWDAVRAIYMEGIATRNATFEQSAPDWPAWDKGHLPYCRLVARIDGEVLGWTALSPVSSRRVYAGVAEFSIYVAERARGCGVLIGNDGHGRYLRARRSRTRTIASVPMPTLTPLSSIFRTGGVCSAALLP